MLTESIDVRILEMMQEQPKKLPQETLIKIKTYLDTVWPVKECFVCKHRDWTLVDSFVQIMPFHMGAAFSVGGETYPCFMVLCQHCGNSVLFNAVTTKIIEEKKK